MTNLNELYKCNVCGNIVEIVHSGFGELVCCNVPMTKLEPHDIKEEMQEKHVPILIEGEDGESTIRVGSEPHPMEDKHYIMFIEAISKDGKYLKREYFKAGEQPEMTLRCNCENMIARELCNLHGLWESFLNRK